LNADEPDSDASFDMYGLSQKSRLGFLPVTGIEGRPRDLFENAITQEELDILEAQFRADPKPSSEIMQHTKEEHEQEIRKKIEAERARWEAETVAGSEREDALKQKAIEEYLRQQKEVELATRHEWEKREKLSKEKLRLIPESRDIAESIKDI
jgi:hypothetical protein